MTIHRTRNQDDSAHDLAYQPAAAAAAARYKVERVTLTLDGSFFKEYWQPMPFAANKVVLGTAKDEPGGTGHTYLIVFSNADFAYSAPNLIIDGSALQGADFSGDQPFFGDTAVIVLSRENAYNAHVTTGGGNDSVSSGVGSDWISTHGGDDFVGIGSGIDTVYTGAGNDYIESTSGDFTALDRIYAGAGDDEISFYAQDIHDADLVQVRSVELIGLSSGGDLELAAEAQRVGIRELFVDDSEHHISVGTAFTRALTINMYGNFDNQVSIDASASSATLTVHAEYAPADLIRDFHGGTGSGDTLWVSAGFSGLPVYGADLTRTTGFEHIVVDGGYDVGGLVTLDTRADEINAAFQTIDAHTLGTGNPLTLKAAAATAALHVVAGTGDDVLSTGSGDDRITGGLGGDVLRGAGGHDTYVYGAVADSAGAAIDQILGFATGRDTIDVTGIGAGDPALAGQAIRFFGNAGSDAGFAATAGNGALDAVFRTDTHTLWFDTNDSGTLDADDLHIALGAVARLTGDDLLAGHVVI